MPRQWFQPPRTLLLVLSLVTAASVSALFWFGWRLAQQEQDVEARRAQSRLDEVADAAVARARAALAREGEGLHALVLGGGEVPNSRPGVVALVDESGNVRAPAGRLLFYPLPLDLATPSAVMDAERLEYGGGRLDDAARAYRILANAADSRVRGEATLHLARVLRTKGDLAASREAYERLAALDSVRVTGGPAGFVALQGIATLDTKRSHSDVLQEALLSGRWMLTRGEFEAAWSRLGSDAAPPADRLLESAALEAVVRDRSPRAADRITRVGGTPLLVIERTAGDRSAVRILDADWLLEQACHGAAATCELRDAEGTVARNGALTQRRPTVRASIDTGLPVTMMLRDNASSSITGVSERRRFIWAQVALTAGFLVTGALVIGRAMTKAHQTAQLQAEFVSAVSHEFRSPLTSIRQLSEMLALGRVPADDRRQQYYHALVGETDRLQRLVERLLQFGRLEAGAASQVRLPVDVRSAVEEVRSEFAEALAERECGIVIKTTAPSLAVSADPEGLRLALRNLVDNALKYSPSNTPVEIGWSETGRDVAITVRDHGIGIPSDERRSIFRKFVRGRTAIERRIGGTGLGLAMVQQIVTSHGGHIEVDSQSGRGSTFSMILPAAHES